MMLSVLIVNYNVCYFLEHCLWSVLTAAGRMAAAAPGWDTEILVIDNASTDESMQYLPARFPKARFPQVTFIASQDNNGFGKANNILLAQAKGKYVLFLNPDTLIPEDCLINHIRFAESAENFGASGIRMIDGSGSYLPESKRGFPGPWVSFTKMAGLASAFPGSRFFAGYYMGHLDSLKTQTVPVLSGAYLLADIKVIRALDGFDEQFFMYAEDIDLSYRVIRAGYKNYYYADETIIHFKGESTSKDKKYVKQFYLAMIQFVRKHFVGGAGVVYAGLLEIAIRGGSAVAALSTPAKSSERKSPPAKTPGTFLTGDQEAIEMVSATLKQRSGQSFPGITSDMVEAGEIIYCMGKNFRIGDAIALMQTQKIGSKKFFRIEAGSVIGSDSNKEQGTVERL